MNFKLINVLFYASLCWLLIGCPSEEDKIFEPVTKKEAETRDLIKRSLDSNALAIENEKVKSELILSSNKIQFKESLIDKQLKEINKQKVELESLGERQMSSSTEMDILKKLTASQSNNLEDRNKLIKELQKKHTDLEEKLKLFHQNSQKLQSQDLKEKNKYIKDLLTESAELKKENNRIRSENKILKEKIIQLEKNPPKNIPD